MCRYLNCIIFIDDRFFSDSLSLNTGFAPNLNQNTVFILYAKSIIFLYIELLQLHVLGTLHEYQYNGNAENVNGSPD